MAVAVASDARQRAVSAGGVTLAAFVAVVLAGKLALPGIFDTVAVPNGMYLQGLVVGLLSGLLAIGLVLVYRANRIVNFAQGALGAFAATLAAQLYQVYGWPYPLTVVIGVAGALAVSLMIEFFVIRRFSKAPRLILTVATIGVAQILGFIELLPNLINEGVDRDEFRTNFSSPWAFDFEFGHVRFTSDHLIVLVMAPAVLVGLALFFRFTRYGVAARASAENAERARLLGIKVRRVSLVVWGIAGLLSALTAILRAPILGFQLGALAGQGLLLRALAAAVIGRMESLPVTLAAAVLLTMGEQAIFWSFGQSGPATGFLFVAIVVSLLLQRKRLSRVDPASSSWRAVEEVRPIPRELRRFPEVRWSVVGVLGLLVATLVFAPFVLSPSNTNLTSVILVYAMVGISLVILTGWSGNVSLGHWALVGCGGLVAGKLATQAVPQDFFVTLLLAGLAGAAVALVIGLPALRIRGLFLSVTTLAFALAAAEWFFQWEQLTPEGTIRRPFLFGVWDITSERDFYFVSLAGLLLALYVGRNIRRSRLGRNLVAMRDNEVQAQTLAIRVVRTRLTAFAVSGFIAALAGALYAYNQQALRADRFPAETSLVMFSMVVIGGMGSMTGAVLGAVYVRGVQYFLSAEFQLLATGFGLLLLLLVFPGGLGQIVFNTRDRLLRRVAERRGVVVPSLVADRQAPEAGIGELVGPLDVAAPPSVGDGSATAETEADAERAVGSRA